jgi:predicted phosphodiesterase
VSTGAIRIAVIADLHANLPALEAALAAIRANGCDLVYHIGDAIAIGPHPRECLDLLLSTPDVVCLMGNHESYFVQGIPDPRPSFLSAGEAQHQEWVRAQLSAEHEMAVAGWPWVVRREFAGISVVLHHYALTSSGHDFRPVVRPSAGPDLDAYFAGYGAALVFYGHDHIFSDLRGEARYVNPGSLGCHREAVTRYTLVRFDREGYAVQHRAVPYDDSRLHQDFERREVPERRSLYRAFFGGRFAAAASRAPAPPSTGIHGETMP